MKWFYFYSFYARVRYLFHCICRRIQITYACHTCKRLIQALIQNRKINLQNPSTSWSDAIFKPYRDFPILLLYVSVSLAFKSIQFELPVDSHTIFNYNYSLFHVVVPLNITISRLTSLSLRRAVSSTIFRQHVMN